LLGFLAARISSLRGLPRLCLTTSGANSVAFSISHFPYHANVNNCNIINKLYVIENTLFFEILNSLFCE
jgi:hypothetical protein